MSRSFCKVKRFKEHSKWSRKRDNKRNRKKEIFNGAYYKKCSSKSRNSDDWLYFPGEEIGGPKPTKKPFRPKNWRRFAKIKQTNDEL